MQELQSTMPLISHPQISQVVPDITQITRFCDPEQIVPFVHSVNAALDDDRSKMKGWSLEYAALLAQIPHADANGLHRIHEALNHIEMERFLLTCSVRALHYNCTHYRDLLASRAMEIVLAEMPAAGYPSPPVPYALASMGSDGREEQTLITDQDYLIVYGDDGGEAADAYFLEFSTRLVDRLEQAGFKRCTGDIMPTNPTWRGSFTQWRKRLLAIMRYEVEDLGKNMMDMIVMSDARYVCGDRELAERLVSMIRDMERDYFQVLWGMAKAATEMTLALGFMKRLWTESSGEHRGEFNLKLLAWAPLVMNVRILAINQGIPASNTVERITSLEQSGNFSAHIANDLRTSYDVLTKHRILLQIKVIKGIQANSYYLNPYQLPPEERERIRHAIIRVEELQRIIHTNFNIV